MIIIANNLILAAWKHSHSSNKTLLCCFFLYLCTTGPDSAHPLVTNMTFWIRYVRNCEALKILRNLNTAVRFPYRPYTLVWLNVSQTVAFLKWNARCIYEQRERNKESGAVLAEVHLPLVEFMTTWAWGPQSSGLTAWHISINSRGVPLISKWSSTLSQQCIDHVSLWVCNELPWMAHSHNVKTRRQQTWHAYIMYYLLNGFDH